MSLEDILREGEEDSSMFVAWRAYAREALQDVYRRCAPAHERNCDWWRSLDEPWCSLAEVLL